jgi:hypothetical protein
MSLAEQLNAALRFAIFFSLIVLVVRHDIRTVFFAVFCAFLTIVIYKYDERENKDKKSLLEKMSIKDDKFAGHCTLPTKNNPFMNVNLTDYKDFPNRPPACNISNPKVKKQIESTFGNVYKDVNDIFGKNASDRQFFTMPSTTIPNDQKAFAEWLYIQNAPPGKQA